MGSGPNFILDKGYLATGSTAYAQGEVVELILGSGSLAAVVTSCRRCTTANSLQLLGVCMEPLDTTRLATAKAVIGVRLLGIARVLVGSGGVTALDRVKTDASAGVVTAARTAGGTQPQPVLGIALATVAAGGYVEVLLTPGGAY